MKAKILLIEDNEQNRYLVTFLLEHRGHEVVSIRDAGYVELKITDTGMGIKPEDLATLFQPFRQIDSGLARNHEGTGLGLAICRRLVDLLGGEIRAESAWEKGSTFTFTLPLKGPLKS